MDRDLPTQPGAGLHAQVLQRQRHQSGGDLLAGGDDGVVFPRVVQPADPIDIADQLVRYPGHGGDADRHLVAVVDLRLDSACRVADAVDIRNRRAAEFLNDPLPVPSFSSESENFSTAQATVDRKSFVLEKSVGVRVELGVRRQLKQKQSKYLDNMSRATTIHQLK